MSKTAEEARLGAGMQGDQETVDGLARDATSTERRYCNWPEDFAPTP